MKRDFSEGRRVKSEERREKGEGRRVISVKGEETMEQFAYRNLIAYQKGKEVVMQTYRLLKKFPREEQYALCDQLRRASTSITSNIAEGMTRHSSKDRSHFLEISYGSLMEVSSQMDVACDLGYITSEELKETDSLVDETARLISGLQKSCSERVPLREE